MRNSILICGLILLAVVETASAQDPSTFPLTPICTVRADPEADCRGATNLQVCVEGVVLAWKQFGTSGPGTILGSDGCAISIFDISAAPDLAPGTLVRVCGWTGPFNGLDEIQDDPVDGTPDPVVTVLGVAPVPVTRVTGLDLANHSSTAEGLESELVRLCGTITGAFPPAGVSANVSFMDSNGNICTLRVDSDTNIDGTVAPGGLVKVTGVLQQFDAGMNCIGYQVLPRSLADIVPTTDCMFSEVPVGLPGVFESSVDWGDFDNDGDLDILVTGIDVLNARVSRVYRNDGGGTFIDIGAGLVGVGNSSAAWGDYDNDGDLDILLTGLDAVNARVSKVYRNNGGGTFTDVGASLIGVSVSSVAWGDCDNDGDLDILLTGHTGAAPVSKVYRNSGGVNPTFSDVGAGLVGVANSSVAWGDYDIDGDLDILLTGRDASLTSVSKVYQNNLGQEPQFSDVGAGLVGVAFSSVAWGDYDNDGDLDILLTGFDGAADISKLYRYSGGVNPTFSDVGAGLTGVRSSSVAWGDYDNDGDLDILLTGTIGGFATISKVYANSGGVNPTFSDVGAGLAPVHHSSVAWGDYDNDGDLDLLVTGYSDFAPVSKLYRNDGAPVNTIPSTPTALSSLVGYYVTLTWSASSDAQTPAPGLSYNLRVGTTPGGNEISSAMASADGYRRVVGVGNASSNLSWTLWNYLPGGTYYWSVQAVDGAFAGSPFAAEQSFVVVRFPIMFSFEGLAYSSVAWGDYDNDGDLDILATGRNEAGNPLSRVIQNHGVAWNFGPAPEPVSSSSVAWGDYDNDGDLDILLTGNTSLVDVSKVYRNDGGGFTDIGANLTPVSSGSVAWGDYDSDGDLDILLTGSTSLGPVSKVYRNDGSGAFTDIGANLTPVSSGSVAWGDYDNDGDLDILLTGNTSLVDVSKVYRNDGGGFTDIGANLTGSGSAAWGDYDSDEDLDILITGYVYRNNGSGTFDIAAASPGGETPSSVAWGDYDNDGDLDILITEGEFQPRSLVYRNDGGGFSDIGANLARVSNGSVAWGDWDSDGDLDIMLTGESGSSSPDYVSYLYRNDGAPSNAPPSIPGNLSAVRNGGLMTFSWTAATDDHTPAAGLSYNLRVGTSAGGDEKMSAMAAPSGYRKVAQLGNAQERTSWSLALPWSPEAYYWSVQAIDGAFQGSPFASGSTVVAVGETPEVRTTFELGPATPNPFTAEVALSFALPQKGRVELAVFDARGRRVRVLARGERPAGRQWAQWDGRDESGALQPSGIYLVRMLAAGRTWTSKLVLAR